MINPVFQKHLLCGNAPARVACLRSVSWVHSHHFDTGAFCLESENREEIAPTRIIDGLRQHTTGKSFYIQIFMSNKTVLSDKFSSCFVVKVTALISDVMMKFSNTAHSLLAVITPLLLSGESALRNAKFLLCFPEETGGVNKLAIGSDKKRFQSEVNSYGGVKRRDNINIGKFAGEGHIPFSGFSGHGCGHDAGIFWNFSMPLHLHRSDELQGELAAFNSASIGIGEAHGIEPAYALEPRITWFIPLLHAAKEILESGIESAKGMLARGKVDLRKVFIFSSYRRKSRRLFRIFYRHFARLVQAFTPS